MTNHSSGVHLLAVVMACAVFPLIFVGAGVTSKGAGMAFPDGFTADGYFLRNPPGWWQQEPTRWEHGHRLLGRAVGLLAIALVVASWKRPGGIRHWALANLAAIVLQGVLGALRVSEVSTTLAMIHGVFGQICFCFACCAALVTSRTWLGQVRDAADDATFLQRLSLAATAGALLQLVSGATVRHFDSSLALMVHVFGAMAVTSLAGWLSMWLMGRHPARHALGLLGRCTMALIVAQLLLGGLTFTVSTMGVSTSPVLPWLAPSAHVAAGALLIACLAQVTLWTVHLLRPAGEPQRAGACPVASS